MEDAVSVVWRWSRDTQFPFIKILLFKYCFDMYTCLHSTCYITLVSYTQNVAYIYILQVIDDIEVFHMEWNDNSWREATWRFFAIYSIILNSTHEYLIKKALLFEYIQIFNSFVASYSTFKSTTLCRSCARHLLLD